MPTIEITREQQGKTGRYVARIAGADGEAELTFTQLDAHIIRADHTEAPPSMRGTGVARALVERLVDDARTAGAKIVPACTYVAAQFRKQPDWSDVLATGDHAS